MKDALQQFVQLRKRLTSEKQDLETRLAEINQALGDEIQTATPSQRVQSEPPLKQRRGKTKRKGLGRLKNPMPLREAVIKVTSQRPLLRKEIIDAVQKLGYRFQTQDPLNTLGVVIYGKNPRFKKDAAGRFSPA